MRRASLILSLVVLAFPASALASDAGSDEADELVRSISASAKEAEALSTDDCSSACKALASMRRATDRLCALEPGPRCDSARAKLDEATNKVRRACPQCAVSVAPQPAPEAAPARESVATASAPPPERRGGGCAGCTTSPMGTSDLPAWLGLATLAALVRRRRQDPRTSSTATLPPRT